MNRIEDFAAYLNASPTAFQATAQASQQLLQAGFLELKEVDAWDLQAGQGYFVTRQESSLIAWRQGEKPGFHILGAHTDSPCLKLKPNPVQQKNGYTKLGVEVYGGALLATWFDRELSLAGRVHFMDAQGQVAGVLVDFQQALAIIPSLAIHLRRDANDGWKINAQNELSPLLCQKGDFQKALLELVQAQAPQAQQILHTDLFFYPLQPAGRVGLTGEFLAGARLDNLASCFVGLQALLAARTQKTGLVVLNDHEEVGSSSTAGAAGSFLEVVLRRIAGGQEALDRQAPQSLMISLDNAHGVHPNYADLHDANHGPLLNQGLVVKSNANQRYATNSSSAALIKALAQQQKIPLQDYATRSDLGCGSTIGPITASKLGINTLDLGLPTFAMHSARELMGCEDLGWGLSLCQAFLEG